jgi:uncharacterized phage-associated protein
LAWHQKPLFAENFEHRANGPVCRKLYDAHRKKPWLCDGDIPEGLCGVVAMTDADRARIDNILAGYARFNGAELSEMSHEEDPWKKTKRNCGISNELMREYYGNCTYEATEPENEKITNGHE